MSSRFRRKRRLRQARYRVIEVCIGVRRGSGLVLENPNGRRVLKRKASVTWSGSAREGRGTFRVGSGALSAPFTYNSRFVGDTQTNPEELLLTALAGCLTMATASALQTQLGVLGDLETSAELDLVPTSRAATGFRRCDWRSWSSLIDRRTSWIGRSAARWRCVQSATRSPAAKSP